MAERISFNINAELYENENDELAIRFPDERVFANVGTHKEDSFVRDCIEKLEHHHQPTEWTEIPAHQLLYARGWHCVARMGYVSGDPEKPGLEFEIEPEQLSRHAREYLREAF
ncbi:hypothetical protein DESUT3_05380 [Desulfuromonas versatilis]|uniref:Uncharacterized protein n=1 Tax=Desulfuromonas versatilis TaxID=2802975 RepID=A0ABM8HMF7_9BACT|nr:hypothetical protein [Desulfuromonas versatilis]BCR03469.1 hypothetical protein DESUT3_05380 [Desulfuromonas versatilis]